MPIYDLSCGACGNTTSVFRRISDYDDLPACSACGGRMHRVISAPALTAGFVSYKSPASGRMIESRNAQREDLVRTGTFLFEPGVDKDIARNRETTQDKAFAPVAAAIDNTIRQMVNAGKISA